MPAQDLPDVEALHRVLPLLVIYALSFVEVGIYWVNHHYMVDEVEQVSHGLLWANLGFLFTLSLIPFGTAWVGERGVTPFAVSLIRSVADFLLSPGLFFRSWFDAELACVLQAVP